MPEFFAAKIGPNTIEHYLFIHPPANGVAGVVVYRLDRQFAEFRASAGIHDSVPDPPASHVTFKVIGDGKVLWQSKPVREKGVVQPCVVDIRGVRVLMLQVAPAGDYTNTWGLWDQPRVYKTAQPDHETSQTGIPNPVAKWTFENDAKDSIGTMHGKLGGDAVVVDGCLRCNGKGSVQVAPLTKDIREKSLEAWVSLNTLNQSAGILSISHHNPRRDWDGIYYTDRMRWYPGSSYLHRSMELNGPQETAKPGEFIHLVLVYAADNSVTMYRNGVVYGSSFTPRGAESTLRMYPSKESSIAIGPGLNGDIAEARLYDRALTTQQVEQSFQKGYTRKPIDLLKLIRPEKDAVSGKWSSQGQTLISPADASARLQIPYEPPGEYDVTVVTERKVGNDSFCFGLIVDKRPCMVFLNGWPANGFRSALVNIDGKDTNETTLKGQVLRNGIACTIIYSIRKTSVTVTVDGKTIISYKGDPGRLTAGWPVPNTRTLWLGTQLSVYHITKMELTPISGQGKPLYESAPQKPIKEEPPKIVSLPLYDFKSKKAVDAKARYDLALKSAKDALVADLREAVKEATKKSDLKTANSVQEVLSYINPPLPADRVLFEGRYYRMFTDKVTWHVAKARCELMGGYLACVANERQNGFLIGITQNTDAWIGRSDEETEGEWFWVTSPSDKSNRFTAWRPGEPNNGSGIEHHAFITSQSGWNDAPSGVRMAFLCQWDKDKQIVSVVEFPWIFRSKSAIEAKAKYLKAVAAARLEFVGQLREANKEALLAQTGDAVEIRTALDRLYRPVPKVRMRYGTHYYTVFKEKVTWHRAKEICESMGGHLACIGTPQEDAFVRKLIGRPEPTWLGGSDEFKEGQWQWVNGESWKYSNWSPGEPNNGGGFEHHLCICWSGYDRWVDLQAGNRLQFVCEWDK